MFRYLIMGVDGVPGGGGGGTPVDQPPDQPPKTDGDGGKPQGGPPTEGNAPPDGLTGGDVPDGFQGFFGDGAGQPQDTTGGMTPEQQQALNGRAALLGTVTGNADNDFVKVGEEHIQAVADQFQQVTSDNQYLTNLAQGRTDFSTAYQSSSFSSLRDLEQRKMPGNQPGGNGQGGDGASDAAAKGAKGAVTRGPTDGQQPPLGGKTASTPLPPSIPQNPKMTQPQQQQVQQYNTYRSLAQSRRAEAGTPEGAERSETLLAEADAMDAQADGIFHDLEAAGVDLGQESEVGEGEDVEEAGGGEESDGAGGADGLGSGEVVHDVRHGSGEGGSGGQGSGTDGDNAPPDLSFSEGIGVLCQDITNDGETGDARFGRVSHVGLGAIADGHASDVHEGAVACATGNAVRFRQGRGDQQGGWGESAGGFTEMERGDSTTDSMQGLAPAMTHGHSGTMGLAMTDGGSTRIVSSWRVMTFGKDLGIGQDAIDSVSRTQRFNTLRQCNDRFASDARVGDAVAGGRFVPISYA